MTSTNENATPLAELAHLLDTWGGERTRWPANVRLRVTELSASGPEAHRLLVEARALDQLLDVARDAPAALSAQATRSLADRILAAAQAETSAPGVALPTRPSAEVIALSRRKAVAPAQALHNRWPAAGLIAASMLVGIYFGGSINLAPVLQELAEVAGLSALVDPSLAANGDDLGEEELP